MGGVEGDSRLDEKVGRKPLPLSSRKLCLVSLSHKDESFRFPVSDLLSFVQVPPKPTLELLVKARTTTSKIMATCPINVIRL